MTGRETSSHRRSASARSDEAERGLYDWIAAEYGLLTPDEAGQRLGSTHPQSPRNLAETAHRAGILLAIRRDHGVWFPGFQFAPDRQPLTVIEVLRDLAADYGRSEAGIVQWLCSPTTYLDGRRPVDLLQEDPGVVLDVAARAWDVQW